MVQLELNKWLFRELGEDTADRVLAFTVTCRISPLDSRKAVMAAEFCLQHRLQTADAVIYATARDNGADMVACDAYFSGLPGVTVIPKIGI